MGPCLKQINHYGTQSLSRIGERVTVDDVQYLISLKKISYILQKVLGHFFNKVFYHYFLEIWYFSFLYKTTNWICSISYSTFEFLYSSVSWWYSTHHLLIRSQGYLIKRILLQKFIRKIQSNKEEIEGGITLSSSFKWKHYEGKII
jgi:hypothetical protein